MPIHEQILSIKRQLPQQLCHGHDARGSMTVESEEIVLVTGHEPVCSAYFAKAEQKIIARVWRALNGRKPVRHVRHQNDLVPTILPPQAAEARESCPAG